MPVNLYFIILGSIEVLSHIYITCVSGIVLNEPKSVDLPWPESNHGLVKFERTSQDSNLDYQHNPVGGAWMVLVSSKLISGPGRWRWCRGRGAVWDCGKGTVSVNKIYLVLDIVHVSGWVFSSQYYLCSYCRVL